MCISRRSTCVSVPQLKCVTHECCSSHNRSDVKTFLTSHAPGTYTCCRFTYYKNGALVIDGWEYHLARVLKATKEQSDKIKRVISLSFLIPLIRSSNNNINGGMLTLLSHNTDESILHIHATVNDSKNSDGAAAAHVEVTTTVSRGPNPKIKHSSWIDARASYFNQSKDEMIIGRTVRCNNDDDNTSSASIELLEGFVTNIFILYYEDENDEIRCDTPPLSSGLLPGYVRSVLLSSSSTMVQEQRIYWKDRKKWIGGFLTNSKRIIQPIASITYNNCTISFKSDATANVILRFKDMYVQLHNSLLTTRC